MPSRDSSTSKLVLTISAAAGSLIVLAAVALMVWPSDPADSAPAFVRDQPDGETLGWVTKVEGSTIHVNSGPFGGGVVPLLVTRKTRITVGSKEGWFEDIRPGGQVKVLYDVTQGRRFARSVELLVEEGSRRVLQVDPRVKSATGAATAERVPAAAKESAPTESASVAAREARPPAKSGPARPPVVPEASRNRVPTTTVRNGGSAFDGARAAESARPIVTMPAPTPTRSGELGRNSTGSGTTDGSEAVDWLLKHR
jgi:hypothetical protein